MIEVQRNQVEHVKTERVAAAVEIRFRSMCATLEVQTWRGALAWRASTNVTGNRVWLYMSGPTLDGADGILDLHP